MLELRTRSTENEVMEKSVHIYTSLDEMKADEYAYWRARTADERMQAVSELTRAVYAMKDIDLNVRRLQGPVVSLQRPRR